MSFSKIRVIHSFRVWLPQTQTWMFNQVSHLPEDVEPHIVCERTENLDQFWLPNIHSLSEASRWRYFCDKTLRRLRFRRHLGLLEEQARRSNAQVLHSHFGDIAWINLAASKGTGLKHVVTFYGQDVNYLPRHDSCWVDRYQALFRQVDLVLCEGPHMARCLLGLGCPRHKIQVHHLGVRVDEIEFRPRFWDPTMPLCVLLASSFREKKGITYALEALGRLQHEIALRITLIGDATEEARSQAEKKNILSMLARHRLEPKTRLLGYQSTATLFEESYKHHVFMAPSVTAGDGDTEGGLPVTIVEMAAAGIPIISTRHCDIPEVIVHQMTGLLAEERDVEGLVTQLKWLVEHPGLWGGMLRLARQRVESEFNARLQGEQLASVYRKLMKQDGISRIKEFN